MAEHLWTQNPFFKTWGELKIPGFDSVKQIAACYIDTNEKWAQQALEWNEKATAWAKETPFAPLFETQHALARQLLETSTALARRVWQIETKTESPTGL
jgi:hypothetical protein